MAIAAPSEGTALRLERIVVVALQKATAMRSDDGRASLWWPHPARWGSDSSRAEKSPIKNMILNVSFAIALLSGLLGYAAADDVAASEKDRTTNPTTIMVVCLLFVMLMVMLVLSVHISTSKQVSIEKLNLAFNL
eukprot:gene22469-27548_t